MTPAKAADIGLITAQQAPRPGRADMPANSADAQVLQRVREPVHRRRYGRDGVHLRFCEQDAGPLRPVVFDVLVQDPVCSAADMISRVACRTWRTAMRSIGGD